MSKRDFEETGILPYEEEAQDAGPSKKAKKQQKLKPPKKNDNGKQDKQRDGQSVDPTYGQRCVIPSANDVVTLSDDDLEFEDMGDAMSYLYSVRQEAGAIPHLLIAPKLGPQLPATLPAEQPPPLNYDDASEDGEISSDHDDDSKSKDPLLDYSLYSTPTLPRGFYQDGAYTAVPDAWLRNASDYPSDSDLDSSNQLSDSDDDIIMVALPSPTPVAAQPSAAILQSQYYTALLTRFHTLRTQLHQDPPPEAVASLHPTHGTFVAQFKSKSPAFGLWNHRLRTTDPLPAQIASFNKAEIVRLLRVLLAGSFFKRGNEVSERTARWAWALLAKLPERGTMDHVEVGWVRELGKRCVGMMRGLEMEVLEEAGVGVGDGDENGGGGGEEDGEEEGEVEDGGGGDTAAEATAKGRCSEEEERDAYIEEQALLIMAENCPSEPSELDEGEVLEEREIADDEPEESLQAAKARLLAQLSAPGGDEGGNASDVSMDMDESEDDADGDTKQDNAGAAKEPEFDAEMLAKMNTRATLNMVITVAGEFYGQRDLLEFRDPFLR